uniref:GDNF/GAS1 domain-containing protein n=1 Tax=Rhodnius prolixus TaxID=13249 RepID=T1HG46_RHOPR
MERCPECGVQLRSLELIREVKRRRRRVEKGNLKKNKVPFWRCMNDTEKNEDRKSWRICCNKAQTERCHRACRSAATSSELPHHCRHSDELDLFACVQKLQEGEECCGLARNPECHNLCRKWLQNPSHVSRSYLVNACSYPVVNCINNISKPAHLSAPHKYLHCCDKASDPKCKEACKKILKTRSSTDDVADAFGDAGCPLTLQPSVFWFCQCTHVLLLLK